jgi:hypothetical protein
MVIESSEKRNAAQNVRGQRWLSLLAGLVVTLTIGASKANAQIVDGLTANIPFEFHVGDTTFSAGDYRIHMLDDSNLTVMEISRLDGSDATMFQVQQADAKSVPTESELIFNKYGNEYFLAELFEGGEQSGSQLPKSRHEARVSRATAQAEERVPAEDGKQRGK